MTRCACFMGAGTMLILMGLGCNKSGTQPETLHLTSYQSPCHGESAMSAVLAVDSPFVRRIPSPSFQSPCLENGVHNETTAVSWLETVRFVAGHDTLYVFHDSVWCNCCSKIRFDVEILDSVIDFVEVDTSTAFCRCVCHFDLGSCFAGLARGIYTARLWMQKRDSLLGEAEVFVPGASAIWYESRCDTLLIHHDGKVANCCAQYGFGVRQVGDLLVVSEADTSSMPCDCFCVLDLTARIAGLVGDQYTVYLRDGESNSLLDTSVVQIAPCKGE